MMTSAASASSAYAQAGMSLDQSKSAAAMPLGKKLDPTAARKTAQDFEQVFVSQMMGQMFAGLKTDSMFGGGHGEEMYRSMMIDQYSKEIVKHGGFGIGDAVMRTLISEQEKSR